MYTQIVNPVTKKKGSISSLLGKKILRNYLINLVGGYDDFFIKPAEEKDTTQNIRLIIREKPKPNTTKDVIS